MDISKLKRLADVALEHPDLFTSRVIFPRTFNPSMVKKLLAVVELAYDFQDQLNEHAMERGFSPALHPILADLDKP
jgi:hypothetical protein